MLGWVLQEGAWSLPLCCQPDEADHVTALIDTGCAAEEGCCSGILVYLSLCCREDVQQGLKSLYQGL